MAGKLEWARMENGRLGRRRFLGASGLAAAGTAGFALVGCGGDDDDDENGNGGDPTATAPPAGETPDAATPTEPAGDGPVFGGHLRKGTYLDVLGIDPHIEVALTGLETASAMYPHLGVLSTVLNEWFGELAESYEQVSDLEIIFTLHDGFNHASVAPVDGRPVTAEDVVYSLERRRDLPEAQNNDFYKTGVASMEAVDNRTFRVVLAQPNAEALIELGSIQSAIVPREVVEERGNLSNGGVGAGAFLLEEYVKGERERLVKNPDYFFADEIYLDSWERITILDPSTLLQAYLNDQVDINGAPLTKLDWDGLPDNLVNYNLPSLSYGSLAVNASVAPYDNPMVRRALYMSFDRQQFIDKLGFGDGLPMGPLSRGLEYWSLSDEELAPYVTVNYEEARAMLEAAGVEEGFEMIIDTSGGVQSYIDHSNIMVSELGKVGINAELALSELGDYLSSKLFAGNFNATIFAHNPYETPKIPLGFYHSNGIGNGSWWNYDNPEISAMFDAQQRELDADTRLQMVHDLQIAILEDGGPLINIYSPIGYGSYHPRVGGYEPELRGYETRRFHEYINPDA